MFFFLGGGELPGTSAKKMMCQSRDFGVDIHSTIVAGGNFLGIRPNKPMIGIMYRDNETHSEGGNHMPWPPRNSECLAAT